MYKQIVLTVTLLLSSVGISAEEEIELNWTDGPAVVNFEGLETIALPEQYSSTDKEGCQFIMESWGNLVSGQEIGLITASSNGWSAVVEFNKSGYVKDDEKDELDADAMLKNIKEGQEAANESIIEHGGQPLTVLGWQKPPFYNDVTKNLEWCLLLSVQGDEDNPFTNHNIRILGRHGVTEITLIASLDVLDQSVIELADILKSFKYTQGNRYAEFRKGDKVAKYGLTALVAGGAAAVALKSGLLKPLLKGLAILGVAISGFFKKLFGKKDIH